MPVLSRLWNEFHAPDRACGILAAMPTPVAPTPVAPTPDRRSLPATEGVRGIAATVVVVWHAVLTVVPSDPTPGQHVVMLGLGVGARWAVLLFIMLSGYLLGQRWDGDTARFLIRRCWRILPPYWVAALLTLAAMVFLGLREPSGSHWDSNLPLTAERVVTTFLLITDVRDVVPLSHPLWTVPVEFHLYLLAPLVALVRRRHLVLVLATLGALVLVVLAPWFIAPHFVLAFAAAFWVGQHRADAQRVPMAVTATVTVAFATICAVALLDGEMSVSAQRYLVADSLLTPLVVLVMLRGDSGKRLAAPRRFLSHGVTYWLGQRSYSVYLMHAVVLELVWRAGVDELPHENAAIVTMVLLGLLASYAVGAVVYRFVEGPTARRASRVRRTVPSSDRAGRGK